jgi:hypothetical protein
MNNLEDTLKRAGKLRARRQRALDEATSEVRQLVVDADGEIPRLRIGQLAGVSRMTVYAWIAEAENADG